MSLRSDQRFAALRVALLCCIATLAISTRTTQATTPTDQVALFVDVSDLDPEWRPGTTESDPILAELALRIIEESAPSDQLQLLGIRELFEAIGAEQSISEILESSVSRAETESKHRALSLHAKVMSEDESFFATIEILDNAKVVARGKSRIDSRTVPALSKAVAQALRQLDQDWSLEIPTRYEHHELRVHRSHLNATFLRLLGRRFGTPHETTLLRAANEHLQDLGLDYDRWPLDAALEQAELLYREYNLQSGRDASRLDQADELLATAYAVGLDNWWYHDLRGRTMMRSTPTSARAHFERALELRPWSAGTTFNLWFLDRDKHSELLARAIRLNPACLRARAYSARSAYQRGDDKQYAREFAALEAVRSYPLAIYHRAFIVWADDSQDLEARRLRGRSILRQLDGSGFYQRDMHRLLAIMDAANLDFTSSEKWLVKTVTDLSPTIRDRYFAALRLGQADSREALLELEHDIRTEALQARPRFTREEEILLGLLAARRGDVRSAERAASNLRQTLAELGDRNWANSLAQIGIANIYQLLGKSETAKWFASEKRLKLPG